MSNKGKKKKKKKLFLLICIFFIRNDKLKNTNSAVIHKHNSISEHNYKFSLMSQ